MSNKLIRYPRQYVALFFILLFTSVFVACGLKSDQRAESIHTERSSETVIDENKEKPTERSSEAVIDENKEEPNEPTYTASLSGTVVDRDTKEPIENAIVYLGSNTGGKQYTDKDGKYQIDNFHWGSYSFNVFKRGYERFQEGKYFNKGEHLVVNVELEKKPQPPESILIQGIVVRTVTAAGTKSENRFFKIKDDKGKEYYIFNDQGGNWGFEPWVDKKVQIVGFEEIGFIGWQARRTEGIYIDKIHEIK